MMLKTVMKCDVQGRGPRAKGTTFWILRMPLCWISYLLSSFTVSLDRAQHVHHRQSH